MGIRPSHPWRVGIALILLGLGSYAGFHRWIQTRNFVPLEVPVSLKRGRIRTHLDISTKARYNIEFQFDQPSFEGATGCLPREIGSALQTKWAVSRAGRAVDHDKAVTSHLGYFDAEVAPYDLDVEVLSDGSCLDIRHPRLRGSTWIDYGDYDWLFLAFSVICTGTGFASISLGTAQMGKDLSTEGSITGTESAAGEPSPMRRRLSVRPRFSALPPFGLIASIVMFMVIVPMWLLDCTWDTPSKGLDVHVIRPDSTPGTTPWPEALIIRIDAHNRWYFNSSLIDPADLPAALKAALSIRADWVLYVEADPDLPFADPVAALEIIRSAHAKVVLLTPGTTGPHRP